MPGESVTSESNNQSDVSSNETNSSLVAAARNGEMNFTHDPEMLGSVAPDREDGMAEAALEAQQNAEIERLTMEASAISPDFEDGIKTELQETAKETLKMKIESKVYDLLTKIETTIGKSIVAQKIREGFAWDQQMANDYKAGRGIGLKREVQREIARNYERDIEIGKRNLRNRTEEVTFTPSGEVIPDTRNYEVPVIAERPLADHIIRTRGRNISDVTISPYSSRISTSERAAQSAIESNPVINKLEEWRGNIKARQENTREAARLVSAYGTAA